VEFDKREVLDREELILDDSIDPRYFTVEGRHPDNQFWIGGDCYVPVSYKAQRFKMRVNIVNPRTA
jgi:hypothetical protein